MDHGDLLDSLATLQAFLQACAMNPNYEVTPEVHQRNAALIENTRQILDSLERENRDGYDRYYAAVHTEPNDHNTDGLGTEYVLSKQHSHMLISADLVTDAYRFKQKHGNT